VLLKWLWLCLFVLLIPFCNNETTVKIECSPRWIVYQNQAANGAWEKRGAPTFEQCLEACINLLLCVAAEWSTACWMHAPARLNSNHNNRLYNPSVTQYVIVRDCPITSGTLGMHEIITVIWNCYFKLKKMIKTEGNEKERERRGKKGKTKFNFTLQNPG